MKEYSAFNDKDTPAQFRMNPENNALEIHMNLRDIVATEIASFGIECRLENYTVVRFTYFDNKRDKLTTKYFGIPCTEDTAYREFEKKELELMIREENDNPATRTSKRVMIKKTKRSNRGGSKF